ncbi:MAG: hypothetical protein AB1756_02065 [Acidobacteriota bacterium]
MTISPRWLILKSAHFSGAATIGGREGPLFPHENNGIKHRMRKAIMIATILFFMAFG